MAMGLLRRRWRTVSPLRRSDVRLTGLFEGPVERRDEREPGQLIRQGGEVETRAFAFLLGWNGCLRNRFAYPAA